MTADQPLKIGDEVRVVAWWAKDRMLRARVLSFLGEDDVAVQPLEGNPHSRYVKRTAINVEQT
jgi:hypothetical protein